MNPEAARQRCLLPGSGLPTGLYPALSVESVRSVLPLLGHDAKRAAAATSTGDQHLRPTPCLSYSVWTPRGPWPTGDCYPTHP
jgi:hypothetical protein